jgi:hypothetical protein
MDREAAGRNIQAAIARRREQFYLSDLDWNVEGYRATFCRGPLTVRRSIDEGTAEDVAPAGEPATRGLATILDEVRREIRCAMTVAIFAASKPSSSSMNTAASWTAASRPIASG